MTFTSGEDNGTFVLTHHPDDTDSDTNLDVTLNGKAVNIPDFRSFYQVLMGVTRAGAAPAEPTGDPEIVITYTDAATGTVTKIELFSYSPSVYIGRFDGGDIFKVRGSSIDYLVKQYGCIRDGKEVLTG